MSGEYYDHDEAESTPQSSPLLQMSQEPAEDEGSVSSDPQTSTEPTATSVDAPDPHAPLRPGGAAEAHDDHEHEKPEITPAQLERLNRALTQDAQTTSRMMGVSGVRFKLGKGWSTNPKTGEVTLDAADLINPELPDAWNEHGVLHELASHTRTLIREPLAASKEQALSDLGKSYHYFVNMVTDIKGNNVIMHRMPRFRGVTDELYTEYLFPTDDLQGYPRHVQLMSAMLMEEMSHGREITVSPEVSVALTALRNYEGTNFDVIKHITRVNKSMTEEMTAYETIDLATRLILPVFEQLLEEDREDARNNPQPAQSGQGEAGEGEFFPDALFEPIYDEQLGHQHGHPVELPPNSNAEESPAKPHAEAMKDFAKEIEDMAKQRKPKTLAEQQVLAMEQETGHTFQEYMDYMQRLELLTPQIEDMDEFFHAIIDERVARIRRLSRPTAEGSLLDPTVLAQTYVESQAGNPAPMAYQDYEWQEREREITGRFDIFLCVDGSGSMHNSAADQPAADSALIIMEGLDSFMSLIKSQETTQGVKLDLDVRTSMHIFGTESQCVKPLSSHLDRKERLDLYHNTLVDQGSTGDYLSLQAILEEVRQTSDERRRRIIFVVADGGSDNRDESVKAIGELQAAGCIIIPIALGDKPEDVQATFGPDTVILDDVQDLPGYVTTKLEGEIRKGL